MCIKYLWIFESFVKFVMTIKSVAQKYNMGFRIKFRAENRTSKSRNLT
jgi:hypothetical protein